MDGLWLDLRYAVRSFARSPGFASAVPAIRATRVDAMDALRAD